MLTMMEKIPASIMTQNLNSRLSFSHSEDHLFYLVIVNSSFYGS